MDNKILYGIMTLIFNSYGVPCFMRGDVSTGIWRIILGVVTCGVVGVINEIMGIILGIKILCMSDEEFQQKKGSLVMGVPKGKIFGAQPSASQDDNNVNG